MPELYAICRPNDQFLVKRVLVSADVSQQVAAIFHSQEDRFLQGVNEEIDFSGDWKPDDDEVLTIAQQEQAVLLMDVLQQNPVAVAHLDAVNFEDEQIRALVVRFGVGPNRRALVQLFSPQQVLSSKFSVFFRDGVFRRLTEPGFCLDTKLLAIVDRHGMLKFKHYSMLRRVFDLSDIFKEATNAELAAFCGHASIAVEDADLFTERADEGLRRLVHAVTVSGVLSAYSVPEIRSRARAIHFSLTVRQGQFVMPKDRKGQKALLSFLLNKVYEGPIDKRLFITNSNRPLASSGGA